MIEHIMSNDALSEVLQKEISYLDSNENIVIVGENIDEVEEINIYELADMCIKKAYKKGYVLVVAPFMTSITSMQTEERQAFHVLPDRVTNGVVFDINQVFMAFEWCYQHSKRCGIVVSK